MKERILCIITARAKSTRLPNKNFRKINGMSLTQISMKQGYEAYGMGYVADVVLSTDSYYLLEQCREFATKDIGIRDERLSGDDIKSVDVVLDVLDKLSEQGNEYTAVMILQPTSPLRAIEDVKGAIKIFDESEADSLITAYQIPNGTINGLYIKEKGGFIPVNREHNSGVAHQALAPIYLRNGAVFISSTELLRNHRTIIGECPLVYEMPQERSIDVDDFKDFEKVIGHKDFAKERELIKKYMYKCKPQNLTVLEWVKWNEVHMYYDGRMIIIDGECIDLESIEDGNIDSIIGSKNEEIERFIDKVCTV